jgi:hypothetical protein
VVLSYTARGQDASGSVLPRIACEGHNLHIRLRLMSIWAFGGRSMLEGFSE